MSRSRIQSLIPNIDHMTCSLSSKNLPRNTVDFEAACSVYIRFRGVNGYPQTLVQLPSGDPFSLSYFAWDVPARQQRRSKFGGQRATDPFRRPSAILAAPAK